MPDASSEIRDIINGLPYPSVGRTLGELRIVREVTVDNGRVLVALELPSYLEREPMRAAVQIAIRKLPHVREVDVRSSVRVQGRAIASDDPIGGVKNVVMVLSGKGGVGKSTAAVNLATTLQRAGAQVGLLDADMYGPSIPVMLGVTGRPTSSDGKHIDPLERHGLKVMSLGFLLEDEKSAVIWRGPMLHGALSQFVSDVAWGKLDYLFVDLPPGTGDVALTLAQKVPASGAVIVTTPQEVALADVYKSVSMCQKVQIPILGVLENMSTFVCPHCHQTSVIFGEGGGDKIAEFAGAPLLGRVPIDPAIRQGADQGMPIVLLAPESEVSKAFVSIASRLADSITALHYKRKGTLEEPKSAVRLPVLR